MALNISQKKGTPFLVLQAPVFPRVIRIQPPLCADGIQTDRIIKLRRVTRILHTDISRAVLRQSELERRELASPQAHLGFVVLVTFFGEITSMLKSSCKRCVGGMHFGMQTDLQNDAWNLDLI